MKVLTRHLTNKLGIEEAINKKKTIRIIAEKYEEIKELGQGAYGKVMLVK